jgi:hypothetical protein
VWRQQADRSLAQSTLLPEEQAIIVRIAFLTELVGYVSGRYAELDRFDAVRAFVADLQREASSLDGNVLRSMFHGTSLPGEATAHNMHPTLVVGMTRFDELIQRHRRYMQGERLGDADTAQRSLIAQGAYLPLILQSLGADPSGKIAPVISRLPLELE